MLRQAGEIRLAVERQHIALLVGQHPLAEGRRRAPRGRSLDRGEPRCRAAVVEARLPGAAEGHEVAVEHARLLGVEPGRVRFDGRNAPEQRRVHVDRVPMGGGEAGRDARARAPSSAGLLWAPTRAKKAAETRASVRPERSSAATVLANVGAADSRRDRRHLAVVRGERRRERRAEVLRRDSPERRRREWRLPGREQRIVGSLVGVPGGLLAVALAHEKSLVSLWPHFGPALPDLIAQPI